MSLKGWCSRDKVFAFSQYKMFYSRAVIGNGKN